MEIPPRVGRAEPRRGYFIGGYFIGSVVDHSTVVAPFS
jgi:hypothetical protein